MNKNLLLTLMNKVVRVDRGGPESRIGKLMAAEDDHFVLLTEKDGIVYYKTQHIKSITLNSRDGMEFKTEDPAADSYLLASDFKTVVSSLRHHWVKVNRGGPEMLEGIMDEVTDDYITIFAKEEIVRLSMYHVRNISIGTTSEKANAENKEQDKSKDSKNDGDESSNQGNTENNNRAKNEKAVNDKGRNTRNRRR